MIVVNLFYFFFSAFQLKLPPDMNLPPTKNYVKIILSGPFGVLRCVIAVKILELLLTRTVMKPKSHLKDEPILILYALISEFDASLSFLLEIFMATPVFFFRSNL